MSTFWIVLLIMIGTGILYLVIATLVEMRKVVIATLNKMKEKDKKLKDNESQVYRDVRSQVEKNLTKQMKGCCGDTKNEDIQNK